MAKIRDASEKDIKAYPTANYPTEEDAIRARISHVLGIYPRINHTMLQVGLGTGFSPRYWRPILSKMIDEGIVVQEEEAMTGPTGRFNMYVFLYLKEKADDGDKGHDNTDQ